MSQLHNIVIIETANIVGPFLFLIAINMNAIYSISSEPIFLLALMSSKIDLCPLTLMVKRQGPKNAKFMMIYDDLPDINSTDAHSVK